VVHGCHGTLYIVGGIQTAGNLAGGNRKPAIGNVNSNEEDLEAAIGVGLGELAEITVNNDADPGSYDVRYWAGSMNHHMPFIKNFYMEMYVIVFTNQIPISYSICLYTVGISI